MNKVLSSEPELFRDYHAGSCYLNQRWISDDVVFEMLHPDSHFEKKRNDRSCVLRVKTKQQSLLITGDIEAKSEQRLVERLGEKLKSTFMLVPHHGSRTSSTHEFIRMVSPSYAIIPVGYKNAYGHPKPDIIERYQQLNIPLLDTVRDGAISFFLRKEGPVELPSRYRLEYRRYWHTRDD